MRSARRGSARRRTLPGGEWDSWPFRWWLRSAGHHGVGDALAVVRIHDVHEDEHVAGGDQCALPQRRILAGRHEERRIELRLVPPARIAVGVQEESHGTARERQLKPGNRKRWLR